MKKYLFCITCPRRGASQVELVVKNPSANAEVTGDIGSIPGLGMFPGGGPGNPLQYSCRGNSMDRGVWRAAVHRVAKSRTQLSACTHTQWILKYDAQHTVFGCNFTTKQICELEKVTSLLPSFVIFWISQFSLGSNVIYSLLFLQFAHMSIRGTFLF